MYLEKYKGIGEFTGKDKPPHVYGLYQGISQE